MYPGSTSHFVPPVDWPQVPGSLFLSSGLGMRKPKEDLMAIFSGSPKMMVTRALQDQGGQGYA
jgi:hypothetical protein